MLGLAKKYYWIIWYYGGVVIKKIAAPFWVLVLFFTKNEID